MPIHVIDSTTLELGRLTAWIWASTDGRKAAAKNPYATQPTELLPSFVIVDTAASMTTNGRVSCAPISKAVEIALFDKAYVDFEHLKDLA